MPQAAKGHVSRSVEGSARERIMKVAKELFAARGYEHTSTSAIARQAGTSESQLMKHFGSKAGVLEAIFSEGWAKITEEAGRAASEASGNADKLLRISQAFVAVLERDAQLKLLMLLEARRSRGESQRVALTEGFLGFVGLLDGILSEMRTRNELREGLQPDTVRSALMGMLEGMLRDRLLAERLGYPAQFGEEQISQAMRMASASFLVTN